MYNLCFAPINALEDLGDPRLLLHHPLLPGSYEPPLPWLVPSSLSRGV